MAREKAPLGHRKLPAGRSRDVGFSRCAAYVSDGDAPSDDPASDGSESDFAAEPEGVVVPLAKQPKGSRVVKKHAPSTGRSKKKKRVASPPPTETKSFCITRPPASPNNEPVDYSHHSAHALQLVRNQTNPYRRCQSV